MNSVVKVSLITQTFTSDAIGQRVPVDATKIVIGYKRDITGQEINEAGQRGIQAELRVDVWTTEYNGADIVEVGGVRFDVYRTYEDAQGKTELYLSKRVKS